MNNPFISIILPVYNVEQYIAQCLESVHKQTFKDFELIIVNDCSPDNSSNIITSYIENNSDFNAKVINHAENKGISSARNTGIRYASGEYIYFLDSDDDITEDCLKCLYDSAIENNMPDIIIGENYIINQNDTKEVRVALQEGLYIQPDIFHSFCLRQWYNQVWNKLYKKDFITRNNMSFAEGLILEDEIWSFQVARLAKSMAVTKTLTYNYYIRPNSTISSQRGSITRWQTFYKVNGIIRNFISAQQLESDKYVSKYFLENLLVTINGYARFNALSYSIHKKITRLYFASISKLHQDGLLSRNESIAYRYFNLKQPLSYIYYKAIGLVLSIRK